MLTPRLASNSLATLYATFTVGCLGSAGIVNRFGPKRALALGVFGYSVFCLAAAAYAAFDRSAWSAAAVVVGGGLNGFGAAILWTAQGRLMLEVAASDQERDADVGARVGVFWGMFNASAVLGGIATYFYFSRAQSSGNAALFLGFAALVALGGLLVPGLRGASKLETTSAASEALATLRLFTTRRAALLTPLFWYTGFNQPYQLNGFGDRVFRGPDVGLELAVFYAASVAGGFRAGVVLDDRRFSPRRRAQRALAAFAVVSAVAYASAADVERRGGLPRRLQDPRPSIAFLLWGFSDAYVQAYAYWLIDRLYEADGAQRARAVAFYKQALRVLVRPPTRRPPQARPKRRLEPRLRSPPQAPLRLPQPAPPRRRFLLRRHHPRLLRAPAATRRPGARRRCLPPRVGRPSSHV